MSGGVGVLVREGSVREGERPREPCAVCSPVPCGVYDRSSNGSFNFRIKAADLTPGEYRWVKLGRCHVGRSSYFWFPGSLRSSFALQDCPMLADGMAVDPNWYEIWASAREGEGVFLIDRLLLRRVKPEK